MKYFRAILRWLACSLLTSLGISFLSGLILALGKGRYFSLKQQVAVNLLSTDFCLLLAYLFSKKWKDQDPPKKLKNPIRLIAWGLITSLAVFGSAYLLGNYLMRPTESSETTQLLTTLSPAFYIPAICIATPFFEELFFRKVSRRMLGELPRWAYVLVSGLSFGIAHIQRTGVLVNDLYAFLAPAIAGMILAWVYDKKGQLAVPAIGHGANNLLTYLISLWAA